MSNPPGWILAFDAGKKIYPTNGFVGSILDYLDLREFIKSYSKVQMWGPYILYQRSK
jgi:hypothetical protein